MLNNVGSDVTILGGMKIRRGLVKAESPIAKAGLVVASGIAGGAMHTVYTGMNKMSNSSNNVTWTNQSSNSNNNSSYSTFSITDNNEIKGLFSVEDLANILNSILTLRIVNVYLLYTLSLFLLGIIIDN